MGFFTARMNRKEQEKNKDERLQMHSAVCQLSYKKNLKDLHSTQYAGTTRTSK